MRQISCLFVLFALLTPNLFGEGAAPFRKGDVFEMRVSGMPLEDAQQFAQQYTVGPDGTINVPLIGEIKALGLTTTELERTLQNRFVAGKIFTQPTVIISPIQGARMVTVIGGVRNPGRLPWNPDLTLTTAIGQSGGPGEFPDLKKVRIIRDSKIIGTFSVPQINKNPALDPKLLPGDQVVVPE